MQIMIDTQTDTPRDLVMLAAFLTKLAAVEVGPGYEKCSLATMEAVGVRATQPRDKTPEEIIAAQVPPPPSFAPPGYPEGDDDLPETAAAASATHDPTDLPITVGLAADQGAPGVATIPPPPAAPQQIPLPPGAPPAGPEYDSAGLPWDARIHLSTKGKTIGGEWKLRKKLPDGLIDSVKAELRAALGTPAASVIPPPPPPLTVTTVTPTPPIMVTIPPPPATPGQPATVPPPPAPGALGFRQLCLIVGDAIKSGKLTTSQLNEALASVGLQANQLTALATRPDLIPAVNDHIARALAA